MNLTSFTGQRGMLRVGYQRAADLGPWELHRTEDGQGIAVSTTVLDRDAYWFGRRPMVLRLDVGMRQWQWRDVEIDEHDGNVTITGAGRPEVI